MKIGILTLHEADSYGAVLQAYALQQTLDRLGARSEFLSFARAGSERTPGGGAYPPALVSRIRQAGERRAALFAAFRAARLRCARPVPWQEAAQAAEGYDRLIVGSDQVWNPRIPGVDERYFLPFAPPEKRFSYAASFGENELPVGVRDWCAAELRRFAGLSVRERSGARLLRELTGRDALVCLDPTLLPDRTDWERLTEPVEGGAYVLLFMLQYDAALAAAAKTEAAGRGLELRAVTAAFMPQCGFDAWSGVGVERWLSLFRHAECVFTNSFHGIVFSLIFGRPFRAGKMTGALAARNGRIEELLRVVGAEAALDGMCPPPDVEPLERALGAARDASMEYLRGIVENAVV